MQNEAMLKVEIAKIKAELEAERGSIESIDGLVKKQIEREPGLWEYDFDGLSAEMWKRFHTLENNSDCLSEEQYFPPQRFRAAFLRRLTMLYRAVTTPFSRSILEKEKQFNLDQQDILNKENIPFFLAMILTMQKMKDRLNVLEEAVAKLGDELEEE